MKLMGKEGVQASQKPYTSELNVNKKSKQKALHFSSLARVQSTIKLILGERTC